jgi:hypothetical protein
MCAPSRERYKLVLALDVSGGLDTGRQSVGVVCARLILLSGAARDAGSGLGRLHGIESLGDLRFCVEYRRADVETENRGPSAIAFAAEVGPPLRARLKG